MKLLRTAAGMSVALVLGGVFSVGCAKKFTNGTGPCAAQTCAELAANCGSLVDSCGNVLDCGVCLGGQTCGAAGPNACGLGTCNPQTCVGKLVDCGLTGDGCGDVTDCGASCDGIADVGGDPVTASGGAAGVGGTTGAGGTTGVGGATAAGGTGGTVAATGGAATCDYGTTPISGSTQLGMGTQSSSGSTSERYKTIDVSRSGKPYKVITNGWGPGWQSHNISWNGTSLSATLQGSRGSTGQPAGYPSVFCGRYSNPVIDAAGCGLPASTSTSIKTGMRWTANGNTNNYNVAWDIWLGDGYNLQSYLMVWLHLPGGKSTGNANDEKPAGQPVFTCVEVANVPGVWDIWAGSVGGKPIVNYIRPKGMDYSEFEFDVKDFINDAMTRPAPAVNANRWVKLVGSQVNSVAVGFEIWNSTNGSGPLKIDDFYVNAN